MKDKLTLQLKSPKIAQLVLEPTSSSLNLSLPTGSGGIQRVWVEIDTTEHWNEKVNYIPGRAKIIVYSDHSVIDGVAYPAIKIGDGNAYLIDLPFVGDDRTIQIIEMLNDHINDTNAHVTLAEKEYWNNKLDSQLDGENLILTPLA